MSWGYNIWAEGEVVDSTTDPVEAMEKALKIRRFNLDIDVDITDSLNRNAWNFCAHMFEPEYCSKCEIPMVWSDTYNEPRCVNCEE